MVQCEIPDSYLIDDSLFSRDIYHPALGEIDVQAPFCCTNNLQKAQQK